MLAEPNQSSSERILSNHQAINRRAVVCGHNLRGHTWNRRLAIHTGRYYTQNGTTDDHRRSRINYSQHRAAAGAIARWIVDSERYRMISGADYSAGGRILNDG